MEDTMFSTEDFTVIANLPNELFSIIVDDDVTVHRGLALACKRFFAVLTPISYSMWVDYAICAGYTVRITKYYIGWYVNKGLHRKDGPAIEETNGTKEWWVNGHLHRVDGPAIEEVNGTKEWWVNGKRHRMDGPAIEEPDGTKEWWINGKEVWYVHGKLYN